jgi:hypothetical protein
MQKIKIERYDNPEAAGYQGYVEPEDKSWILYVALDGAPLFHAIRAEDGRVLCAAVGPHNAIGLVGLNSNLPPKVAADQATSAEVEDRTPKERAASIAKMRAWLENLPPQIRKIYEDLRRDDAHGRRRSRRADAYAGRYFSCPDGSDLHRVLRGATGAVLHTIRPDGGLGLTSPDDIDAALAAGLLVERPDVRPPDGDRRVSLDALFAAASPEWQEVFRETERRDPKMRRVDAADEKPVTLGGAVDAVMSVVLEHVDIPDDRQDKVRESLMEFALRDDPLWQSVKRAPLVSGEPTPEEREAIEKAKDGPWLSQEHVTALIDESRSMGETGSLNDLDPGIRRTVAWLQSNGFRTTDSGDGVAKFQDGDPMEGAQDFPHVVCMATASTLCAEALRMMHAVAGLGVTVVQNGRREPGQAEVHASMDPVDGSAIVILVGVGDADLFPEQIDGQGDTG